MTKSTKDIVITELGDQITIKFSKPINGSLATMDERTGVIHIDPGQSKVGIEITLLHELLHLVDSTMVTAEITNRRINHKWIESASLNLLGVLVFSGRYKGISKEDFMAFVDKIASSKPKNKKKDNGGL